MEQILLKVASGELSAASAALLMKPASKLHYKVSPKGAVSFYGLRKMPITIYIGELEQLMSEIAASTEWSPKFGEFVAKAGDSLTRKKPAE